MTTLNIFTLLQETHPLLYIGLLLLCGYVSGEHAHLCRFPRVSGYLVTGILLGPSGTGLFHSNLVHQELNLITHIALGIIAFSIGGSLEIRKITSLGRQIAWITICQAPLLIRRYLGLALLPKAGVTVGLILEAKGLLGELPFFTMILSGVLGSVLINELLAPLLTRFALQRAGEIEKH